jgi:hypothetical protein
MDHLDRLSLLYVALFSFLYKWEDLFYFKLLSVTIILYFLATEIIFLVLRVIFSYKFQARKSVLFQNRFMEYYDIVDKIVEDSIRREFFRSFHYKVYWRNIEKRHRCNFLKVKPLEKFLRNTGSITGSILKFFLKSIVDQIL